MINIFITSILICLFFLLGHIVQSLKKIVSLTISIILKILSLFGIKISLHEKHVKLSEEFKNTYKEIKIVKISKKNIKQKSNID